VAVVGKFEHKQKINDYIHREKQYKTQNAKKEAKHTQKKENKHKTNKLKNIKN
jgi:hypothetical protein